MPQAQRRECSFSLPKNISKFANYLNHSSQTTLKENYATTKKKKYTRPLAKSIAALNFRANELTCVSFYCWRATEAVWHSGSTSAQVTVMQCIVGWSNYSSLSSSHSHVPHSRNSTFCLATAIPQMQSGWQRTITVQHQVTMTTAIYLICISCLHYRLSQIWSTFAPSPPLHFLFASIFTTAGARFASRVHRHQRFFFFFFSCRMWMKRGSACANETSLEAER